MMTVNEFKEAMKTDAMKFEFAAFLNERNVETAEALIQAMADFAVAKGCDIAGRQRQPVKVGALTDDELEDAAGGRWLDNSWEETIKSCYSTFDISKLGGNAMELFFGKK